MSTQSNMAARTETGHPGNQVVDDLQPFRAAQNRATVAERNS
ncbi:uncharacterized protein HHUB_1159 [Halobacterium hubeiense]|uniref:Uncharacterized protein n=1 Tax=Halobacterium hubeiense TaxID=1407499 RepID=A0A0U5H0Q1_9EURY|nr:uncharacterized protein HHUB_1159 [Halobacterium hubeiense]